MILSEQTAIAQATLPIPVFKDHLRLGTGFADDGAQDGLLEQLLRSAISAIEARTDKITLTRDFLWSVSEWRLPGEVALPVAPVDAVTSLTIVDRTGATSLVDAGAYRLMVDTHRPHLAASGPALPTIPTGGVAEIGLTAGYGATWGDMPADLAQAVFLLGAHFYEHRHDTAATERPMPHGVDTLLRRYMTVRLLGGAP